MRGNYELTIRNWRQFFPKEDLLILRFEDIKKQPLPLLRKCFCHLKVDDSYADNFSASDLQEKDFLGSGYTLPGNLQE